MGPELPGSLYFFVLKTFSCFFFFCLSIFSPGADAGFSKAGGGGGGTPSPKGASRVNRPMWQGGVLIQGGGGPIQTLAPGHWRPSVLLSTEPNHVWFSNWTSDCQSTRGICILRKVSQSSFMSIYSASNDRDFRGWKSLGRKCEKMVHPVTTPDRRYALCLKYPLKSVPSASTRHNSKTIELLPYNLNTSKFKFNMWKINEKS